MKEEVKLWWELALDDLDTAQGNLAIGKYHVAALFAQQGVEKALKALYIQEFGELRKTHNLVFLATKLGVPDSCKSICKKLDPVYLQTRYPDVSGTRPSALFTHKDATEFITSAREVLEWLKKKIL